MTGLFIHGGGDDAYAVDRDLFAGLSEELGDGIRLEYPHVVGLERIDWKSTAAYLAPLLRGATEGTIIVAHSLGASAILKALSIGVPTRSAAAFLLAPPYKAADSHWGCDEWSFPNDLATRLPRALHIAVYHCDDDAIIPVDDAERYAEMLPSAKITRFASGGHAFDGAVGAVARDIRAIARAVRNCAGTSPVNVKA